MHEQHAWMRLTASNLCLTTTCCFGLITNCSPFNLQPQVYCMTMGAVQHLQQDSLSAHTVPGLSTNRCCTSAETPNANSAQVQSIESTQSVQLHTRCNTQRTYLIQFTRRLGCNTLTSILSIGLVDMCLHNQVCFKPAPNAVENVTTQGINRKTTCEGRGMPGTRDCATPRPLESPKVEHLMCRPVRAMHKGQPTQRHT